MNAPDHQLRLPVIRNCNKLINDPDPLQSRLQHTHQKFISIDLLYHFLIAIEAKSQIEYVLCHDIDDDALVVSNLILKIDNPLVLEVSL